MRNGVRCPFRFEAATAESAADGAAGGERSEMHYIPYFGGSIIYLSFGVCDRREEYSALAQSAPPGTKLILHW